MQKIIFAIVLLVITTKAQEEKPTPNGSPPVLPPEITRLEASATGRAPCRILDKIIPHGEEWTHPEKCVRFICYDKMILKVDYCNELKSTGPNCIIVPIRPNLDYPYCCPKVVCD